MPARKTPEFLPCFRPPHPPPYFFFCQSSAPPDPFFLCVFSRPSRFPPGQVLYRCPLLAPVSGPLVLPSGPALCRPLKVVPGKCPLLRSVLTTCRTPIQLLDVSFFYPAVLRASSSGFFPFLCQRKSGSSCLDAYLSGFPWSR